MRSGTQDTGMEYIVLRLTYTMAAGMFRWSIEKWDTGYRDGIHSATSDLHYGRWQVQVEY